jgi:hypothetical protein
MRNFEYKLFYCLNTICSIDLSVKDLNKLANEGWRVIGVVCTGDRIV